MIRHYPKRDLELEHLPPRPRLLAPTVRLSPELAVLAVVDDAVRSALVALLARYPALHDQPDICEPIEVRRARRLARTAFELRDDLDEYRDAVQECSTMTRHRRRHRFLTRRVLQSYVLTPLQTCVRGDIGEQDRPTWRSPNISP